MISESCPTIYNFVREQTTLDMKTVLLKIILYMSIVKIIHKYCIIPMSFGCQGSIQQFEEKHYQISHNINCKTNCTYFIDSILMTFSHRVWASWRQDKTSTLFYKFTYKSLMVLLLAVICFVCPFAIQNEIHYLAVSLVYITLLSPIADMREPANTGTCLLQWAPEDVAIVLSIPNVVVTCIES